MLAKLSHRLLADLSLGFCAQVLKLDHMTCGLWDGDQLDLEGLRTAQARLSAQLLGWIPPNTRTVLDVGCGAGENARILQAKGIEVEGLAPGPIQQKVFRKRTGLPFHLARFEKFEPQRRYDLVLMSESAQFLVLDRLFSATAAVAPGGHLLIADSFNRGDADVPIAKIGHRWERFLEAAERRGFRLEREEDVTQQVLPTLELATLWMTTYGRPAFELFRDTAAARSPLVSRLLHKMLASRLQKLEESTFQKCDAEAFARHKRYSFLLFAVPGG